MKPDYRDIVGGLLMSGIGVFVTVYALANYKLGGFSKLGPGAFPTAMGVALAVLGGFILIPALMREGPPITFRLRPILFITAALAAFPQYRNEVRAAAASGVLPSRSAA